MSYLGRSAKLSLKAQEKVSFLATAGQTVKTGLSYTPSFIEVYVNGVLLTDTTDFTATNGNSITFTVALLLNDEVTVVSLKTFTVADHYNKTEADTLLAAKATNTALALKAPIASPSFTGTMNADGLVVDGAYSYLNGLRISGLDTGNTIYQPTSDLAISTASGAISLKTSGATAISIDNAGIVTKPLQPAFSAGRGAGNVAVNTVYVFETVRFNIGSHYNNSNGRFTAPVSGRYHINVNLMSNDQTLNNKHYHLRINGSEYQRVYSSNGGDLHHRWNWNGVISLQANDYVDIFSNVVILYGGNALYSDFSGYLLG